MVDISSIRYAIGVFIQQFEGKRGYQLSKNACGTRRRQRALGQGSDTLRRPGTPRRLRADACAMNERAKCQLAFYRHFVECEDLPPHL